MGEYRPTLFVSTLTPKPLGQLEVHMATKRWESYEEVAVHLLNELAKRLFGLGRVEGKQVIPGQSGAKWAIDGKGCSSDGSHFRIVECKRYTKSKVRQDTVAGLAYRIRDAGASGGIFVTTLGLQKGAQTVAAHERIYTVHLDQNSTSTDYILRFLNQAFVGMSTRVSANPSLSMVVVRKDGTREPVQT